MRIAGSVSSSSRGARRRSCTSMRRRRWRGRVGRRRGYCTSPRRGRAEEGVRAQAAWQAERARVRTVGEAPSLRVVTATEHAAIGAVPAAEVAVESAAAPRPRPHGKRFGTLVHAVLAAVELDAGSAAVADTAALQGRLLGATAEEVEAAIDTAVRALAHPLLRRAADAARAGRCRRECPIGVQVEGGVLVEGVGGAAFLEG